MSKSNISKRSSPSKRPIVIASVMILTLLAVVLFLFVYRDKIPFLNTFNTLSSSSPQTEPSAAPAEQPNEQPIDKQYLVLEDWAVKFKIPNGLTEVKYYYNAEYDSYDFTTERVEALGGQCKEPPEYPVPGVIRLISVARGNKPVEEGRPTGLVGIPLNDNVNLGGYYYRYNGAQSSCANGSDDEGIQSKDRELLRSMVNTIEVK